MERSVQTNNRSGTQSGAGMVRGLARSIIINGAIPWAIYHFLKNSTNVSDLVALLASGIPSILDTLVGIIRYKRVDLIAGINLLAIGVSLILLSLGGDPKLYLIRESLITVAIGLAFLISMLLPKSLVYYAARQTMTGNTPEGIARFEERFEQNPEARAKFRAALRPFGFLWGFGLLLEAIIRTYLVYTLSIEQFLVVSPFVLYGITGLLFAIQFWLMRRVRKRYAGART